MMNVQPMHAVLIPTTMKLHVPLRFCMRYIAACVVILALIFIFYKALRSSDTDHGARTALEQPTCPEVLTPDGNSTMTPSQSYQLRDICDCPRVSFPLPGEVIDAKGQVVFSACDAEATARGANQSVVSFTFYAHVSTGDFLAGPLHVIQKTALKVAQMYPGFVMRVYHDLDILGDADATKAICDLWCENSHLDFCYALHLPYKLCNQQQVLPSLWRFFVLGDPLVNRFMIRDIDSEIIQREVDSVQEWIGSGKTWHIMRDHPSHSHFIIPGMWSGMNRDMTLTTALRDIFIRESNSSEIDQDLHLLERFLWPIMQKDMVSHDSYLCSKYAGTSSYPSQRPPNMEFVGNKFSWKGLKIDALNSPCPVDCRPKDHLNWTFC